MRGETPITVRAPRASLPLRQDFLGGAAMIGVAVLAYSLARDLPFVAHGAVGPGMMPKILSVFLAILGLLLLVGSYWHMNESRQRWPLRGPLFVFGSMVLFGLAVRPLGLAVAGPLVIVVAACASNEIRWQETIVTAVVATVFSIGLFKFALGLPIPLAPWLVGY